MSKPTAPGHSSSKVDLHHMVYYRKWDKLAAGICDDYEQEGQDGSANGCQSGRSKKPTC